MDSMCRSRVVLAAAVLLSATVLPAAEDPTAAKAKREAARRDWKVVVGSMKGVEGRAAELVNSEIGPHIVRDEGVYALHTLPVVLAADSREIPGRNLIVLGTLADNPLLREWFAPGDIPADGYSVKVFNDGSRNLMLVAGAGPKEVLWGAADLVTDGLRALKVDVGNGISLLYYAFDGRPVNAYTSRRAPKTRVRSVFTWGHVIGDWREYFRNLALLKLNEAVIWNDYEPLNAAEIVEYAHSWGVDIVWGYAWGWTPGQCRGVRTDDASLAALEDRIVGEWRRTWGRIPGDGIYFQSFTETRATEKEGRSIAESVVKLVNGAAKRIWAERPGTRIIFGLHATSVRDRLGTIIGGTDPKMEIYWEDFGGFPYDIRLGRGIEAAKDAAFVAQLTADTRPLGFVYKCELFQDWSNFYHQGGPYLLGVGGERLMKIDREATEGPWRGYAQWWLANSGYAAEVTRTFQSRGVKALCLAGNFNGKINFAMAYPAELFWDASEDAEKTVYRVFERDQIVR